MRHRPVPGSGGDHSCKAHDERCRLSVRHRWRPWRAPTPSAAVVGRLPPRATPPGSQYRRLLSPAVQYRALPPRFITRVINQYASSVVSDCRLSPYRKPGHTGDGESQGSDSRANSRSSYVGVLSRSAKATGAPREGSLAPSRSVSPAMPAVRVSRSRSYRYEEFASLRRLR